TIRRRSGATGRRDAPAGAHSATISTPRAAGSRPACGACWPADCGNRVSTCVPGCRRTTVNASVIHPPAIVVLAALALSAAALTGCPQSRDAFVESAREPGTYAQHARAGQPVRGAASGTRGSGTLALPDDFPDDVYLPADYRINSLMDRGALRVVSLRAPGQVPALFGDARARVDRMRCNLAMAMR